MVEAAPTRKELKSLVANAHNSSLVNAVRMNLVNFIQLVKIMELVLSILLTIFQLRDVNVTGILVEQSVIKCLVIFHVIMEVYVLKVKLVNA